MTTLRAGITQGNVRHGLPAVLILTALAMVPASGEAQSLDGTEPLAAEGDLAMQMVEGIKTYLVHETAASRAQRSRHWKQDFRSADDYSKSVAPNRERLRKILGATDPREPVEFLQYDSPVPIAEPRRGGSNGFKVFRVRWPVLEGMAAEGLLLEPNDPAKARVVAIPDADESPEMLAGLAPGVPRAAQFARRLAEQGCQVLVPVLIDRRDTWAGNPKHRLTNQPHREYLYRMALEVGRHVIGYEVQKVLAAIDWFERENASKPLPIGVIGYGEGGMLALYSGALDTRIQATVVSGYYQPREDLWREPIYRDVWGLLREFGDAEIASLVAPRTLIVEASSGPEIAGPPASRDGRADAACPNGKLSTPPQESVRMEVDRARPIFSRLGAQEKLRLIVTGSGQGLPGSDAALSALLDSLGVSPRLHSIAATPIETRETFDGTTRNRQQFYQMVSFTQRLVTRSSEPRAEFWARIDTSSPQKWEQTSQFYRDYIWEEVIGRMPAPSLPANPRTRLIYDTPKFKGYEVVLDVWPEVFAYGILLVPRDIEPGERRPVVVCQHGLEGRPQDVADPHSDSSYYHRFGARLAEEGFVVFAPQNPYIGEDRFRIIQRMAHPLKLSLFSFILGQQQRTLEWLGGLPFVDPARIGFYGLSYGGKTAMRVPPLLPGYALSICSADFNEWVWKNTSVDSPYSYLLTKEYDMIEFDFANVVNYAELAMLMAPRPFMVERGHHDPVAPDEWVAYEYAKVRRFYVTEMRRPENTEIEFFDGPHTIHAKGTFEFLRRHLRWPEKPSKAEARRGAH